VSATAAVAPGGRGALGLSVSDLHSGYGPVTVLHGVGFDCEPGQVLGITGPNGAGKSTLMSTLAGLIAPSRGTIALGGDAIERRAAHRRVRDGLALVPEGRQVIGGLTVASNLDVTVMARGKMRLDAEHRRRREEVLGLFPRLRERLDIPAASLSGGEQQMLAIGRALMTGPRVLLLDEPSQGLSVNVVAQVVQALGALRGALTMIVVEQSTDVLDGLVDRTLRMSLGRIQDA
jgi:branched-chain amino acid transport system ATP-binding protein